MGKAIWKLVGIILPFGAVTLYLHPTHQQFFYLLGFTFAVNWVGKLEGTIAGIVIGMTASDQNQREVE